MDRRRLLAFITLLLVLAGVYYFYKGLYSGIVGEGHVDKTTVEAGDSIKVGLDRVYGVYDNPHSISYSKDSSTGWCNTDNQYGDYYCMAPVSVTSWWEDQVCVNPDYSYMVAVVQKNGISGISFDPTYDDFAFKEYSNASFGSSTGVLVYGLTNSRTSSIHPFADGTSLSNASVEFKLELRWQDTANRVAKPFVAVCTSSGSPSITYIRSDNGSSSSGFGTFSWTGPDGSSYTCYAQVVSPSSSTWDNLYYRATNLSGKVYFILGNTCWLATETTYPSAGSCANNNQYTMKLRLNDFKMYSGTVNVELQQWDNIGYFTSPPVYTCTYYYRPGEPPSGGCSVPVTYDYTFAIYSNAPEGTYQFSFHVENSDYCHFASEDPEPYGTSQTGGYLDGTQFQVVNYADTVSLDSVAVSSSDDEITTASITVSGGTTFDYVTVSSSCGGSKTINKSDFSCSGSTCTWSGTLGFDTSTSGQVSQPSADCTVTATLYVNGSSRDTDSKSVTVYYPRVNNFSVPDTSSTTVSYSFQACGAFSKYKLYLDSLSNEVASKTLTPPSSPGQCRDVSDSIVISNLTKGTHTLYVRLYTSDEGEYYQASDSFYANITYTGSVTVTAPQDGATVNQQVQTPGTPSQSVTTSASYTTNAPSATLKVYVNGSEKYSWTVSGSGSKSYTAQPSSLTCGTDTFAWKLYSGSDLLGSDSSSITLRCWYDKVGPSGTVQVPSSGGQPLPSSYVDVYVDADVTPSVQYSVKLLWNGTDVSSKLTSQNCTHTYCARITPSDVGGFSCGQTVNLEADLLEGSQVRATSTSTITLQCVEQYVIIREPSDGTSYDVQGQEVPSDFEINVAVDYAGGDTVKFLVNGSDANASPVTPCSYDACYSVSGPYHEGNNVITARLFNGSDLIAEDNVTVYIYTWSFLTSVQYGTDTALINTKEYGSHATRCEVRLDDENAFSPMYYDEGTSTWTFQVTRDYDKKSYEVVCYSPSGSRVYDYNGTINFSSGGAGGGSGGGGGFGGGGGNEVPEVPKSIPVWPATASVGDYTWSVLDASAIKSGTFTSASVSSTYVCVKSKDIPSVTVCTGDVPGIPASSSSLQALVEKLKESCHRSTPSKVGELYCVKNEGSGLYTFAVGKDIVPVLVAKRGVSVSLYYYAVAGIALVVLVYMMLGSRA